ncbi:MAG TPA: DUF4400 domain-containing protein [Accumulibacter sp.]|nr:DUF4400 domain-containing protein [Accumulibacter sp.]
MIRAVVIVSLLGLLVLVLWLPSAHPPERFMAQLRLEHAATASYWGEDFAARMLARALSMQDTARDAAPLPSLGSSPPAGAIDIAIAHEMTSVNRRLFDNSYFRSIDALLLLAMFRLALLVEWLPWMLPFTVAALGDGGVVRVVKAREFRLHSPEMFATAACGAILVMFGALVTLVVPATLHPVVLPLVPVAVSLLLAHAFASYHKRG